MPYAAEHMKGRIIHDADSHLMELPDALDPFLDPKFRVAAHEEGAPRCRFRDQGQGAAGG
jgi:hypothetical protein